METGGSGGVWGGYVCSEGEMRGGGCREGFGWAEDGDIAGMGECGIS